MILNEMEETTDKAISKYLLTNIEDIENLTINNIVDNAHVSHSSIRRFSNDLGFKNFSELQRTFSDIAYPSNLHLRKFYPTKTYVDKLQNEINDVINELNEILNDGVIHDIVTKIYECEDVIFLGANNTSSNLVKFQQELFYANKVIRVITDNYIDNLLSLKSKKDFLMVIVSVSGVLTKEIYDIISSLNKSTNKIILITGNRDYNFTCCYDEIIYMSKDSIASDAMGVLGKYGITYLLDIISHQYIYKTSKK